MCVQSSVRVLWCMQSKLSLTLKEYRLLHGAHVRNPGALIYPSTLRYMPAFLLGLVKSSAFRYALPASNC